LLGKVFRQGFY
jgi:hypothetical protein